MTIATEYASGASGFGWTTPTNANADDAAYATYTIAAESTTGGVNTLTSFGFDSSIPVGATINSVALEVEHKVSTNGGIAFLECAVAISGTPGTFNSDGAEPLTDTARSYTALTRPGGGSWARADLLDAVFTVQLRARSGNSATSVTYSWDYARVVVDYTPAAQALTPSLFTSTTGAFYAATVAAGAVALTAARVDNTSAFYAPVVSADSAEQALTAELAVNTAIFYGSSVSVASAAQTFGAGPVGLIQRRRKTDEEVRQERIRLGIIPAPVEKVVAKLAAQVVRRAERESGPDPLELLQAEHARIRDQLQRRLDDKNLAYQQSYMMLMALEIQRVMQERDDEEQIVHLLMDM